MILSDHVRYCPEKCPIMSGDCPVCCPVVSGMMSEKVSGMSGTVRKSVRNVRSRLSPPPTPQARRSLPTGRRRRLSVNAGPRSSPTLVSAPVRMDRLLPQPLQKKARIADRQSECLRRRDFACPELNTGVAQIRLKLVALARVDAGDSIAGLPTA